MKTIRITTDRDGSPMPAEGPEAFACPRNGFDCCEGGATYQVIESAAVGNQMHGRAGKRPGKGVYVHVDAIRAGLSNLNEKELAAYQKAIDLVPDFSHEFTHIFGQTVRLLRMSSLLAPHPHVTKSKKVDVETGEVTEGNTRGQLFHRLDKMINPCDPTYEFHRVVTRFEEQKGLIGNGAPTQSIHSRAKWEALIESKIGMKAYNEAMKQIRAKHLVTPEQIKKANSPAQVRRNGWQPSVTPEHVAQTSERGESVLNFGCGVQDKTGEIPHSRMLRQRGLHVTDYDFGENSGYGDLNALDRQYDTVMASNVLNVQQSIVMLRRTLAEIASAVKGNGRAVMNYPGKPRQMLPAPLSPREMGSIIREYFSDVKVMSRRPEGRRYDGPIFEVRRVVALK